MNEARYKVRYFELLERNIYAKIKVKHFIRRSIKQRGKQTN